MKRNDSKQTLVRVYTLEGKCHLDSVLEKLFANKKITGLTVFRGIAGFGPHHHMHKASMMDLSNKLPLVIEFFHQPEGLGEIINEIHRLIEKAHIVHWSVDLSFEEVLDDD